MDGFALITITILAVFLGFEVVSKVSSTLHTPLMSEANAIHGIILLGAILVAGQAEDPLALALSILAVLLATINVVGGFVVTDRMLLMFRAKPRATVGCREVGGRRVKLLPPEVVTVCYIIAAVLFILALKGLSNPRTARRANLLGAAGAALAVLAYMLSVELRNLGLDPRRDRRRLGHRGHRRPPRADDADAAARRGLQRRRRRRRGARRARRDRPQREPVDPGRRRRSRS